MAAYRRVYDSRHLQADCQEPGSAQEPYTRLSSMGYLYLFTPVTTTFIQFIFFRECFHCRSFQPVNCDIISTVQSLQANIMKVDSWALVYYNLTLSGSPAFARGCYEHQQKNTPQEPNLLDK